jgi:hypothetical protein
MWQFNIYMNLEKVSPGVKWLGHGADHSPPRLRMLHTSLWDGIQLSAGCLHGVVLS